MKDYEALSREHFDGQAEVYDGRDSWYYSKFPKISCRRTAEFLKGRSFGSLLDVGCGTGFFFELLLPDCRAKLAGLDISPAMLAVARRKFGDRVSLVEGTAASLPFGDGVFDVVTCIQSFHHYPYPEKAMSEFFRVLSPGGLFIISDTGCGGITKRFDNMFLMKYILRTGDYRVYDVGDISRLVREAGFAVSGSEILYNFIYKVFSVYAFKERV
jgi:ubiquinone/menaquinone biosynthesis C-methylase UbiE